MNQLTSRMRTLFDVFIERLFKFLTMDRSHAYITRFAITFLDIWQAIIIVNHNYWIPQLLDISPPVIAYTIFAIILAVFAILALIFSQVLWLSVLVLAVNCMLYLLLGIAALWYYDPPRASFGFSFFVMFISLAAFWRVFLLQLRDRAIRTE